MLKLSKKGSYAIKAILYISKSTEILKVSEIAKSEKIPEALLRRIIADLEKDKILTTIKGRNGGVKLGKETSSISIYDILSSIGEELGISDCTKGLLCGNQDSCTTTKFYNTLQAGMSGLLKIYTLDKILK